MADSGIGQELFQGGNRGGNLDTGVVPRPRPRQRQNAGYADNAGQQQAQQAG